VSGGGTSLGYSTGLRGSAAASQVSGYADRTPKPLDVDGERRARFEKIA